MRNLTLIAAASALLVFGGANAAFADECSGHSHDTGTALGAVVTGGADGVGSLVLYGAVAGAFVGVAQGLVLGARRILPWALTVAGSWAIAWIVTKAVIVDEQKGFVTFGLSGAAIATLATGLALRAFLGARRSSAAPVAAVAA